MNIEQIKRDAASYTVIVTALDIGAVGMLNSEREIISAARNGAASQMILFVADEMAMFDQITMEQADAIEVAVKSETLTSERYGKQQSWQLAGAICDVIAATNSDDVAVHAIAVLLRGAVAQQVAA